LVKANAKFISVNLEAGGGGQFAVIPLDNYGKLAPDYPVLAGHTAAVLDTDFNPFNDCTFIIVIIVITNIISFTFSSCDQLIISIVLLLLNFRRRCFLW
jgi:hypothetical protein